MRLLRKYHTVISFQTKEATVSEVEVNSVLSLQLESQTIRSLQKTFFLACVEMLVIQLTNFSYVPV